MDGFKSKGPHKPDGPPSDKAAHILPSNQRNMVSEAAAIEIEQPVAMAVFVSERPEELIGYWIYSTELFEQSTIQRMVRHFVNLLQSAISEPDLRLSALAMLSPEEIEHYE